MPLSEGECESLGLPIGSTTRAVHCLPLANSAPWWVADSWVEREPGALSCLHIRILGCWGEVWFM